MTLETTLDEILTRKECFFFEDAVSSLYYAVRNNYPVGDLWLYIDIINDYENRIREAMKCEKTQQ